MNEEIREVAEHMRDFGLHLLGKSIHDTTFDDADAPYLHAMAVTICAQGAELLIKSRIFEHHPLLIFPKLTQFKPREGDRLNTADLLEKGQTLMYGELPSVLWAVTGHHLKNLEQYHNFGKLRNAITHFAVPNIDLAAEVYSFAFEVMSPMVKEFWDKSLVEYANEYFEETNLYVQDRLDAYEIDYRVRAKETQP